MYVNKCIKISFLALMLMMLMSVLAPNKAYAEPTEGWVFSNNSCTGGFRGVGIENAEWGENDEWWWERGGGGGDGGGRGGGGGQPSGWWCPPSINFTCIGSTVMTQSWNRNARRPILTQLSGIEFHIDVAALITNGRLDRNYVPVPLINTYS